MTRGAPLPCADRPHRGATACALRGVWRMTRPEVAMQEVRDAIGRSEPECSEGDFDPWIRATKWRAQSTRRIAVRRAVRNRLSHIEEEPVNRKHP